MECATSDTGSDTAVGRRLTGVWFSGRRFFSRSPRPLPLALSLAPDRFSRASKQDGAGDRELRVFRGFSAIKHPQTACKQAKTTEDTITHIPRFWETPTYPSPNPTCFTYYHLEQNVGFGKG